LPAASNALFAALQATAAQQIGVSDILLVAANTTGGVTGCLTVKRNRSDSLPTRPTAAQAMAIDCGEIILPVTPPVSWAGLGYS
jgi:hypothetical protein